MKPGLPSLRPGIRTALRLTATRPALRLTAFFLLLFLAMNTRGRVSVLEQDILALDREISVLRSQVQETIEENSILLDFVRSRLEQSSSEQMERSNSEQSKRDRQIKIDLFEVTAYTKECGYPWDDGITYTGETAVPFKTVAVDPEVIPLGSKVLLLNESGEVIIEATASDIGSAVKGRTIDIYMGEGRGAYSRAMQWGRRRMLAVYSE